MLLVWIMGERVSCERHRLTRASVIVNGISRRGRPGTGRGDPL
jgi:hypothetical protein